MQKMTVWCCGDEKATTSKKELTIGIVTTILLIFTHIFAFFCDVNDKNTPTRLSDHILFGIFILITLGWLTALMISVIIQAHKAMLFNKQIDLYLYPIFDFIRIETIPKDLFILYADTKGIVLAEKRYTAESNYFASNAHHFSDFTEFAKKNHIELTTYPIPEKFTSISS